MTTLGNIYNDCGEAEMTLTCRHTSVKNTLQTTIVQEAYMSVNKIHIHLQYRMYMIQ